MSTEGNKAIIHRWIKARNTNDLKAGLLLWVDERQERIAGDFNSITQSFPDVQITPKEMLAEGDKVMLLWTFTGTQLGTYQGIPATGKKVSWDGIDIYTIRDRKLASIVQAADNLNLLQQLGANTSVFFPFTPA